jgi:hypothetical protein
VDDRRDLRDLGFRRLIDAACHELYGGDQAVFTLEGLVAACSGSDDRDVGAAFRHRKPGLVELADDLAEMVPYLLVPSAAVVNLIARPHREVASGIDQVDLFHSCIVEQRVVVLHAKIKVRRAPNGSVVEAKFVAIEDYDVTRQSDRLLSALTDVARASTFRPSYARLRCCLVLGPSAARHWEEVSDELVVVAAVHDVALDVFQAPPDPNDTQKSDQFRRRVLSGRYGAMFSVSNKSEKWIHKLGRDFAGGGRHFYPTRSDSISVLDELISQLPAIALAYPERPTLNWGAEAVRRVEAREASTAAFCLTARARGHLTRNAYPRSDRMLEHLERLADMAEGWSAAQGEVGERLEDWARLTFDLRIALHDRKIRDSKFIHEGVELDNTPHVKVDDFTNANECGRIYFAIDGDPRWRIVVDHIGLHSRS